MSLTDTHIRSLKPDLRPRKYFADGGLFLFLYVPTSGSKLWRMAYRFDGNKLLSFGEYPTISLRDARERREDARRLLAKGVEPYFRDILTDKGLIPSDIEADGKLHRCPTQTRSHKQNGAYIAHVGPPATLW